MLTDVIIVGAGLSGLTAALELQKAGKKVVVLEAEDKPGGRVSTEKVDGFLLDKGFQVMLTAYPETQKYLDYRKLRLRQFIPGAILLKEGTKHKVADPRRVPSLFISTLLSPAGTFSDKMKLLWLSQRLQSKPIVDIFKQEEKPTMEVLREEYGFSRKLIDNFLQPFMAGIFLETELQTSRRMFDFTLKMFIEGYAALPEMGMEEIPRQLSKQLGEGVIHYKSKVKEVKEGTVRLTSGQEWSAPAILLATEACGLTNDYLPEVKTNCSSITTFYFSADKTPVKGPFLVLNTKPNRFVNHLCVPSELSRAYAPGSKSLISVSVIGIVEQNNQEAIKHIKQELKPYFGQQVQDWHHIKNIKIRYALPDQRHVQQQLADSSICLSPGLYVCGDHLLNGSINGAMRSGAFAAEVIIRKEGKV
ncbi:NAD(P)/FAD-dependent oxidoreductase [Nafulsella turpanensis]|uniref:NAD(P)/FAD-dependent oxidoreductase n=1 Tax=Nafulsella turpanensis TaxID=1265690 RepID=UPI0003451BAF|nr:NAD(P)/FAD-dependent oxidoreductase [Nafulsella turpanensis]